MARKTAKVVAPAVAAGAAWHWGDWAREILIVVIGVLIALAAGEAADALNWRQQVRAAEQAMNSDITANLAFAAEQAMLEPCVDRYLDAVAAATRAHDAAAIRRMVAIGRPFAARPWRTTAWDAALSTEVANHFPPGRLARYAALFAGVATQRDRQFGIGATFVEATSGRDGIRGDVVLHQELLAIDRLRSALGLSAVISRQLLAAGKAAGLAPPPASLAERRARLARCEHAVARAA